MSGAETDGDRPNTLEEARSEISLLKQAYELAFDEGYAKGYEEGFEDGRKESALGDAES